MALPAWAKVTNSFRSISSKVLINAAVVDQAAKSSLNETKRRFTLVGSRVFTPCFSIGSRYT